MRTRVTLELLAEARAFSLRWACEHCAHFDPSRLRRDARGAPLPPGACGNAWPNDEHREARLREGDELAFCKEFEG
jgi:hypothetical protein